ncbi:MAG TPA: ABC transporter substrate-binding protein, partial [Opitutales bacterium]|nr:ABC transporter substrate-binding protein [Opitutales bacterium]
LLPCVLLLTSCTKNPERPADKAAREQIFLVGMPGEPESMDPHLFFSNASSAIANCIFEGLVCQHPQHDTEVLPGVAYKWETSKDGLHWTFYLRSEARWSNGDPVTAHDFVASYERELNPKLGARFAEML